MTRLLINEPAVCPNLDIGKRLARYAAHESFRKWTFSLLVVARRLKAFRCHYDLAAPKSKD